MASREGKVDIIRFYIDNLRDLVDIDCKMMDGWTPFFYAAVNGYLISVEILAKEGHCNVNALDRFNRTSLHWAARYNNNAMVKKLLELGVNHEVRDKDKQSVFELAKEHSNYEVA